MRPLLVPLRSPVPLSSLFSPKDAHLLLSLALVLLPSFILVSAVPASRDVMQITHLELFYSQPRKAQIPLHLVDSAYHSPDQCNTGVSSDCQVRRGNQPYCLTGP